MKKLKIFLVSLIMIPSVIFMSACTKPEDPPTNTLTTEQKNEAFGKLKDTLNEDYSEKAATNTVVSTSTSSRAIDSIDFSQSSIVDESVQQMVQANMEEEMNETSYDKTEIAYNNDGTGYNISYEGETEAESTLDSEIYFVKDGTKIARYELNFDSENGELFWANANYVSPEHSKYESVNEYFKELGGLKEAAIESEDFEEFIEEMSDSYLDESTSLSDDNIDLDIDLTLNENVYTISGTCTMTNVPMEMMGMNISTNGVVVYTLKFTESNLLEYSLDMDLELNMGMPETMFGGTGTGLINIKVNQNDLDKVVFSETFDENKMVTDFSEYAEQIGTIANYNSEAIFHINGYKFTTTSFDFEEGYSVEDINFRYNDVFDTASITWYTDEACTIPFTATENFKSFDTIELYAKNVAVPTGSAAVIEVYDYRTSIDFINLEWNNVHEFYSYQLEEYDIYVTINNGERTLCTESEFVLEEGKTYLIEYIDKISA